MVMNAMTIELIFSPLPAPALKLNISQADAKSAWAAETEHHGLGDISNRNLLLTLREIGEPKSKTLVR